MMDLDSLTHQQSTRTTLLNQRLLEHRSYQLRLKMLMQQLDGNRSTSIVRLAII